MRESTFLDHHLPLSNWYFSIVLHSVYEQQKIPEGLKLEHEYLGIHTNLLYWNSMYQIKLFFMPLVVKLLMSG